MSIWYDVSGLYDWRGNFTGIQRAVYNIGQNLAADDPSAHFFIFQHGVFREVNFKELEDRLVELRKVRVSAGGEQSGQSSIAVLRHHGIVAAKQVVMGSRLETPLRKTYGGMRSVYRSTKTRRTNHAGQVIFSPEDVVVIVDGNWQFRGYAQAIIAAKEQVGFKLTHFVHDLAAIKNPALANTGADKIIGGYFESIFPHADALMAISESTKRDVEWFAGEHNVETPTVSVVLLGCDVKPSEVPNPEKPAMSLPEEFILAVSTVEVRKNYLLLYYAYKQAVREGKPLPHLVIVGRKGWMAEETYSLLTKDPEIKQHISLPGGISDAEREWLYAHCMFTVSPSFYEGWGIPIAESLLHGKCCISSDTSSMPEVGGNLVRYISPYDAAGVVTAIREMSDEKTRQKLEARIKTEYKPVTWQDTYKAFRGVVAKLS